MTATETSLRPAAAPGTAADEVAIIVVHGVGDNQPGSTVNYVVKSLTTQQTNQYGRAVTHDELMQADRHNEVYTFREPSTPWQRAVDEARKHDVPIPGKPARDTFSVYGRRSTLPDGRRAAFYELHWADLARGGTSWWQTIRGFARFVFEIPHAVDGFLRGMPGIVSWLLRRLLLLATCFVRGPIAGYSVVMLAGGLIFLSFGWIPDREEIMGLIGMKIEQGGGMVSLLPPTWQMTVYAWMESLRNANSRSLMIQLLLVLLLTSGAVGLRFRHRLVVLYLSIFVFGASAFYLLDILALRPDRYPYYAGFVYVDYISVMLFGIMLVGVYVLHTRRTNEVGFADLGMFMAFWALFFIIHLSVVGDEVRRMMWNAGLLYGPPVTISTSVTTLSSIVHFQAFSLFYPYLGWLWAIWALVMVGAFVLALVLALVNFRSWGEYHRGIGVALALACVQACVWLTALPALGIMHMDDVLCRSSLSFSTVKQPVSCQTKLAHNRDAVDAMLTINYGPMSTELERMPSSFVEDFRKKMRDRFRATLDIDMLKAMRELTLSFIWNGFILVVAGVVAVFVALYRHLRARSKRLAGSEIRLPRLIVNNLVLALLLALGALNVILCLAWVVDLGFLPPTLSALTGSSIRDLDVPAEVVQMAMLTTTALLVIGQLPQISTPLSGVLQIMRGLIDHHYRTRISIAPRFWLREADQPIRRDHITSRLDLLVSELITGRGYKSVILLSHSQGSVIVYDYLRDNAHRLDKALGAKVHVLTAGSPLGVLYAYYFNEYGDMDRTFAALAPQVASWTNLYRSDDPIAGSILDVEGTSAAPLNPPFPFRDIQMPPNGHLRYWEEAIVCDAIRNLLAGRPAIPPPTA